MSHRLFIRHDAALCAKGDNYAGNALLMKQLSASLRVTNRLDRNAAELRGLGLVGNEIADTAGNASKVYLVRGSRVKYDQLFALGGQFKRSIYRF